jgi:hypothetical protein
LVTANIEAETIHTMNMSIRSLGSGMRTMYLTASFNAFCSMQTWANGYKEDMWLSIDFCSTETEYERGNRWGTFFGWQIVLVLQSRQAEPKHVCRSTSICMHMLSPECRAGKQTHLLSGTLKSERSLLANLYCRQRTRRRIVSDSGQPSTRRSGTDASSSCCWYKSRICVSVA